MFHGEPDYENLPSRAGQRTEDGGQEAPTNGPHPFWSERAQDEYRLQQYRPRDLDDAVLEAGGEETMLGAPTAVLFEPPYSEGQSDPSSQRQETLVREAPSRERSLEA